MNLDLYIERLKLLIGWYGTQKDFADAVGLCRAAINHQLRGRNFPRADSLYMIAFHCGVSVDWLLGLTDEPGRTPRSEKA